VSALNIHRLIYRDPGIAWDTVTIHLLSVIRNPQAPGPIRLQAAEVLDSILVVMPRNLSNTGDHQAQVQERMLSVLAQQVSTDTGHGNATTAIEIRLLGLQTLHQLLQLSVHTLVTGWEIIFGMLSSVCSPLPLASGASTPVTVSLLYIGLAKLPIKICHIAGFTSKITPTSALHGTLKNKFSARSCGVSITYPRLRLA
jgi:hypothetical protein